MASGADFGLRIGVQGEREFRQALADINQSFKVLGSEMTIVSSQYDKNDKSASALAARSGVLNKEIDAQKEKISTLQAALKNASESFGENDRRTQNWQIALNKAQAELNGMEKELDESGKAADNAGGRFEKLGGIMKGLGAAIGVAAVAAGAAAVKLGKEVIQSFGELEQNLGGSEAVFGKYAASIQKTGEDAYKNLGVSQSQYLATANKMGALFQGSGLEQQKSLELTEKAMQRAADMSSVMGIEMSVALDAVTGAAKGNFSMMDNIGVAMNATTIEAYALSKGLDFAWKSASNAEKAEVAMQMFFETTEQYAGNFAKESTQTISGSLGLLTAAAGSFVAGLGNADADMKNLTKNLVDAFQAVVTNLVPVIENMVAALPTAFAGLGAAIGELLPPLLTVCTELFSQVLSMLLSLLPTLIPVAVDAILTIVAALIDNLPLIVNAAVVLITTLVAGLGSALPELIPAAVKAILTVVQGLVDNIPMLIDAALKLIVGLAQGLIAAIPVIIEALPKIIDATIKGLLDSLPLLVEAGVMLLTALVTNLPLIIETIIAALPLIIDSILSALITLTPLIIEAGVKLLIALVTNLPTIIIEIVKAIPKIIDGIVKSFISYVPTLAKTGLDLIKGLWKGILDAKDWLMDKIRGFMDDVTDSIKDFFGIRSPSTLYADIGRNLGLGIGVGFEGAMKEVGRDMRAAIPTDFDIQTGVHGRYAGGSGFAGGTVINQNVAITSPKALSEKEAAREFKNLSRKLALAL